MRSVSAMQLAEMLQNEDVILVDVREEYEREQFNIGGLHVRMEEAMQYDFNFPPGKPVVFYCEKGIRSGIVIQRISSRFPGVEMLNLAGGMSAWRKHIS